MNKKFLLLAFAVSLMGFGLYITNYFIIASSEALQFAELKIRNSDELKAELGEVRRVRLSPIGPFRHKWVGSDEWVSMMVEVVGASKSTEIDVNVKKIKGTWYLESAKRNGQRLKIS